MRYKIGDEVRIKTWKEMRKKYGMYFVDSITEEIDNYCSDRVLMIKKDLGNCYTMKNVSDCFWVNDNMIECLVEYEPIHDRFEILDL